MNPNRNSLTVCTLMHMFAILRHFNSLEDFSPTEIRPEVDPKSIWIACWYLLTRISGPLPVKLTEDKMILTLEKYKLTEIEIFEVLDQTDSFVNWMLSGTRLLKMM